MKCRGMLLLELLLSMALLSVIGLMSQTLVYRMCSLGLRSDVDALKIIDVFARSWRWGQLGEVDVEGGIYPVFYSLDSGCKEFSFEEGSETPYVVTVNRFSGARTDGIHLCARVALRVEMDQRGSQVLFSRWIFI